jgi:molybdate-binding protein
VLPLLRSSGQALDLLRQGLVHVAGVHLTDASGHGTNDRVVRERLGRGYGLIHRERAGLRHRG